MFYFYYQRINSGKVNFHKKKFLKLKHHPNYQILIIYFRDSRRKSGAYEIRNSAFNFFFKLLICFMNPVK